MSSKHYVFFSILLSSIFLFNACKKETVIEKGKVQVTFNTPDSSYPKNYPPGSTSSFQLKDTNMVYTLVNDSTLDSQSDTVLFNTVKTFDLAVGYYTLSAPVTYEMLTPGFPPTTSDLKWTDRIHFQITKDMTIYKSIQ